MGQPEAGTAEDHHRGSARSLIWQRAESVRLEEKAWQAFRDKGITITRLTPEQRAELKQKTQPVRDQFSKEIPAELLALIAETQN